jgi:hypothetical protein
MHFSDAKIGQDILIYISPNSGYLLWRNAPGATIIPAIVLRQDSDWTTLGWKLGEKVPSFTLHPHEAISPEWIDRGIVVALSYNANCECLFSNLIGGSTEDTCKQCGKMNDMGVLKCWWCQAPYPTVK